MPIIDSFGVKFNHTDRHLSYLPFAHIFERSILWLFGKYVYIILRAAIYLNAGVYLYSGNN